MFWTMTGEQFDRLLRNLDQQQTDQDRSNEPEPEESEFDVLAIH